MCLPKIYFSLILYFSVREIRIRWKQKFRILNTEFLLSKSNYIQGDCGECLYCLDRKKFGGPEKLRSEQYYLIEYISMDPIL